MTVFDKRTGFGIERILKMIPHRYPFLLIDRVLSIEPGQRAVALKNVTINENFFVGHFPEKPVMPGVLIIEAMAQTAAVCLIAEGDQSIEDRLIYFTSIDAAKFRKIVQPGDALILEISKIQSRGQIWKIKAEAKVEGEIVAEAIIGAMLVEVKDGQ